jgi:beta-glucanase (GH16 family)
MTFHTLALSWLPQELVYYFDGVPIRRERRLLPLGCQVDIIANLAVFTWARAQAASMDIDYIGCTSPGWACPKRQCRP